MHARFCVIPYFIAHELELNRYWRFPYLCCFLGLYICKCLKLNISCVLLKQCVGEALFSSSMLCDMWLICFPWYPEKCWSLSCECGVSLVSYCAAV